MKLRSGIYVHRRDYEDRMNPEDAEFRIRVKDTPKSFMLSFVDSSFRYAGAQLERLFGLWCGRPTENTRKVRIPKDKPCMHAMRFSDYDDTWFVLYPYQAGAPFMFDLEKEEVNDGSHQHENTGRKIQR